MQSITPPHSDRSTTTPAGRTIAVLVELLEIGRSIELHPEPWSWPASQRIFRASSELKAILGEVFR